MFPFELNFKGSFGDNIIGNFLLVFSSVFSIAFYGTFELSHTEGFAIFVLICGIFSAVLEIVMLFLPTTLLKTHLAAFTFQSVFAFMLSAATLCLNLKFYRDTNNVINLISLIISILLGLFILYLLLNPKFSFRIKGEEAKDEEGNTYLKRPKKIFIAFSEWMILISSFINQISIILFIISRV